MLDKRRAVLLPGELEAELGSSEDGVEEEEDMEGGVSSSGERMPWLSNSSCVADWTSPPVSLSAASAESRSNPKYNSWRDRKRTAGGEQLEGQKENS